MLYHKVTFLSLHFCKINVYIFSRWNAEPNDFDGQENCGLILQDGTFNDFSCFKPLPYICELQSEGNICKCLIFNSRRNCTLCLTFSSVFITPPVIHWYATGETVLYVLHGLPDAPCPSGWIPSPSEDDFSCYFISNTTQKVRATWFESRDLCQQLITNMDGYLLAINNQDELVRHDLFVTGIDVHLLM